MEKSPRSEAPMLSNDVLKTIKANLKDYDFATRGHKLDSKFFGFKDGKYKMFLTENKPVNKKNIGKAMPYTLDRIPTELLSTDNNIELVLTNNTDLFLTPENDKDLQTASGRRRWYVVKDEGDRKVIYWHIRDDKVIEEDDLVGGTDAAEMMSFLSLLHILRKSKHSDLAKSFAAIKYTPDLKKFKLFTNEKAFETWRNIDINVRLDFEESRRSAVDILVDDLKDRLPKSDGNKPFLLIGNDFSWRLTMFSLFLQGENLDKLRQRYKSKLEELNTFIKASQLEDQEDLIEFIEKYYLLTKLSKEFHHEGPNDPEIEQIYQDVFSAKNYRTLGYKRLLYGVREPLGADKGNTKRSITGEPVDYWDPNDFDKKVLKDESGYVQKLFEKLLAHKQPILSIPYLNGKISPELAVKLIKNGLVDDKVMGFLGKVGFRDTGSSVHHVKRGSIIMPRFVKEITHTKEKLAYPQFYNIGSDDKHFIHLFDTTIFTTTPAVPIQSNTDFEGEHDQDTALESEQYYIVEAFKKAGLSTQLIGSFYISDISRKKAKKNAEDNINSRLTPEEAAISVALTTVFEISQILKFRENENNKRNTLIVERLKTLIPGLIGLEKFWQGLFPTSSDS